MAKGFDRLAKPYRWLEHLAFGRSLARARSALLGELTGARCVLILGEGDGRFLAQLLRVNSHCTVECIDSSRAMLQLAQKRAARTSQDARVTFRHRDALTVAFPENHYDLIVTLFFLDTLTHAQLDRLVSNLARCLVPGGLWYVADFCVPSAPLARLHSQLWLRLLYTFFNWQTDMSARTLLDPAPYLAANGLEPLRTRERRFGMLYSRLLRKQARPRNCIGSTRPKA